MNKKASKSHASASRAFSGRYGAFSDGTNATGFGGPTQSQLSHVYEPPDLSTLSDPHAVVAFKNIQKKDSTTKAKALEDLERYIESRKSNNAGLEEGVLEAWIKVYPRTSIDNSRRVRQLAHTLQGQIALSCGKRLARYMPQVVGPWLSGVYDNDKSVIRTAQESFKSVFPTEEKYKGAWKIYQSAIVKFGMDAVQNESSNTLSDERTTTPDDANSKYSRTLSAILVMVMHLLEDFSKDELTKSEAKIQDLLASKKLWNLASNSDPFVRRSVCRLLVVCLATRKNDLDPSIISSAVLTTALHADQAGSAYDYAKAIALLSSAFPSVWTEHYQGSGKKSAKSRLCHFLRKGSQGGPSEFWTAIESLLKAIPTAALAGDVGANDAGAVKLDHPFLDALDALHKGVTNKAESQLNSKSAWETYLSICAHFATLSQEAQRQQIFKEYVLPLLPQFVRPSAEQLLWNITGSGPLDTCCKACRLALEGAEESFLDEWQALSAQVIEDISVSHPEQSKDYANSQDSLAAETSRWYKLSRAISEQGASPASNPPLTRGLYAELAAAISSLMNRNGKPYGAASAIEAAIQSLRSHIATNDQIRNQLQAFANHDLPRVVLSPSAEHLIHSLDMLQDICDVQQGLSRCSKALERAPQSAQKVDALRYLFASPSVATNAEIMGMTTKAVQQALSEDDSATWSLISTLFSNLQAPKTVTDGLLSALTSSLSLDDKSINAMHGLERLEKSNPSRLQAYTTSDKGTSLLSKLLFLAETAQDTTSAKRAQALSNALQRGSHLHAPSSDALNPSLALIQSSFADVDQESISTESLFRQARKIYDRTAETHRETMLSQLLPSSHQWSAALGPFIQRAPTLSLAACAPLGSAMALIEKVHQGPVDVPRDSEGQSLLLRLARYTLDFIREQESLGALPDEQQMVLAGNLALTMELAGDNISVQGSMPLWEAPDQVADAESVGFVMEAQEFVASWFRTLPAATSTARLLEASLGTSPTSYYNSRAFSRVAGEVVDRNGQLSNVFGSQIKASLTDPAPFRATALLSSASHTQESLRICNDIVAKLTDLDFAADQHSSLRLVILLNSALHHDSEIMQQIPRQRIVFFVKHIVEQLPICSISVEAEFLQVLQVALPLINEIYGSFWGDLVQVLGQLLDKDATEESLPLLASALRLCHALQKPSMRDANDDLLDSWTEHKAAISQTLLKLLVKLKDLPDESHQPRRIVNSILRRLLGDLSEDLSASAETLYPVLASESEALQSTGYEILQRAISRSQEEVTLEKGLNKSFAASLPDELLSLILPQPSLVEFKEASFKRTIPPSVRSYLLGWKLTLTHWEKASYAVQLDYGRCLQEGQYIPQLLHYTSDILIISRHKPVDASQFSIDKYTLDSDPPAEFELHWLLTHLYYLILLHLPSPAKAWWRDTTSRQTNTAVQAWTEKHISPLVIASELSAVKEWASSQESFTETPLTVKVSHPTREITASVPIDERRASISIRLPPSYPLARAEVTGVQRVGVAEKKWQCWIRNAQGQLTISDGGSNALIDCLQAWRRNVTAAMKGQTECAICYSVVGGDKTLPKKECPTCKNRFHAGCLFRWFKSSNSSSCPLCRNTFAYS